MAPFRAPQISCHSWDKMHEATDGFSDRNCLGRFQFGKVYRGVGDFSDRVVKVYDKDGSYEVRPGDNESRVQDEDYLAHDDYLKSHPNMVKIVAVSMPSEKVSMVVYDIEALHIVHNLIDKDSFTWFQRVKVALGLASILARMHDCKPISYIIRNVSAAHVLLDKEYNPKLYDFSMISGGNLTDKGDLLNQYVHGCHGYVDPDYSRNGKWSEKCDVFAYGVVLISLISKQIVVETSPEPFLYEWAYSKYQRQKKEHNSRKFSLAHLSFVAEAPFTISDGAALSKLAIRCVDKDPMKRPTMKHIVGILKKMPIVQFLAGLFYFENAPTTPSFFIPGFPPSLCYPETRKLMIKKLKSYSNMKRNMTRALSKKLRGKDIIKETKKENKRLMKKLKLHSMRKRNMPIVLAKKLQEEDDSKLIKKQLHYNPPRVLSYNDLRTFTDGFSDKNYIDVHQFGKLYHGKVESQAVTVRTWEDMGVIINREGENERRFREELVVLQHPTFVSHPHVVNLIGYCYEDGKLGAVYDLESLGTVANLIEKDSFTWRHRINFATKLARLLKYLQDSNPPYEPYVLRNLFVNDILVDKDYNPKLFNFGMLLGGILNDKEQFYRWRLRNWLHCIDPYTNCDEYFYTESEIYSFGMVLLNLLTKKSVIKDYIHYYHAWPHKEYKRADALGRWGLEHFSLADESFGNESDFDFSQGKRASELVMQCIHRDYEERPTIDQVISFLEKIR